MPKEVLVEVFHEETNFVVLRVPNRNYPGVLIQGDSLAGLVGDLKEALKSFETDRDEARGCLSNAYEALKSRLDDYIEVCRRNGIR